MEKKDLSLFTEWLNNIAVLGEYNSIKQMSKDEAEKQFLSPTPMEQTVFIVEKKDRTKIGYIWHWFDGYFSRMEIGYALIPSERNKGYGTEAVQIMVDYLFLSKDINRIQAETDVKNIASQRVLEKNGFQREGTLRKASYLRGEWIDIDIYSILREEWNGPKILTKKPRRTRKSVK
jgi:RimJ/RimL family protein N-acetyltransferase